MTKINPFLSAKYPILCACRLQPPCDDCAFRVQRFSSVKHVIFYYNVAPGSEIMPCIKIDKALGRYEIMPITTPRIYGKI